MQKFFGKQVRGIIITVIGMAVRKRSGIDRLLLIPGEQKGKGFPVFLHALYGETDSSVDFTPAAHAFEWFLLLDSGQLFKIGLSVRVVCHIGSKDINQPLMAQKR